MYNVVSDISQQPTTIIWYTNAEKFRYDSYLAISAFILLSYLVGVTLQLGEYYNFFWLKWQKLDGLPR